MAATLEGKVALITGAASGIGRVSSLTFAREGAKVVVVDVNADSGEETVTQIKESGGDALFFQADVSKASDVEAMVNTAVQTFGRLDCAFNNAGIIGGGVGGALTHEHPEDLFDRVISVNLKGVWLCLKYEIAQMIEQGGGAIVNASAAAGLVANTNVPYVASKHGVVGLTKSVALQYAQQGIRVNAVCPGVIRTPMVEHASGISISPERQEWLDALHPIGRMGTPQEVAESVVWLCSDAASFVTGHAMPVDGGYVAQ